MTLEKLMEDNERTSATVRTILNILLEAPYFYKTDDPDKFMTLRRYAQEFKEFFGRCFGWELVMDAKCARLYKPFWFNEKITPVNRDLFNFTRRDACIAFLLLLEFFEFELKKNSAGTDDDENLKFRYGELLEFECRRFRETLPKKAADYDDKRVGQILREVMPTLERYRFLLKLDPPKDQTITETDTIYECLPALWHYNAEKLAAHLGPEQEKA